MPRDRRSDEIGDRDRFEHMLSACRDAASYARGRAREDLDRESMLLRALVQCVEVIGEAAARTTDEGRARVPGLPWSRIVGMRHILVHAYYQIDADAVWRVVTEHVPQMVVLLEEALAQWPDPDAAG
jgi:uncharacterized protein with HEPN domain